jgi:2',3'-cyclic-nucleotide 2'-phosphodiesterase (5'-nucleotidase family)
LPVGDITVGIVVGILPFDNTIVAVNLTGTELRQVLQDNPNLIVGGAVLDAEGWRLRRNGEPFQDAIIYRVLVNSYMYAGGDNLGALAAFDHPQSPPHTPGL